MTVSIELAVAPEQGLERAGLLRVADEALYQANHAGRNRVAYLGADTRAERRDGFSGSRAGREAVAIVGQPGDDPE